MYKYNKIFQNIVILFWVLSLLSINTIPENFFLFIENKKKFDFLIYLNFFRFILPFIIFSLLITSFLLLKKKFNDFIIYFFLYGFWQLIILTIINRNISEIGNYQLIISLLSLILLFYFSYYFCSIETIQKILYINLIFISLIALFFLSKLIPEYIQDKNLFSLYGSSSLNPNEQLLMQPRPRSTGMSRTLIIIFYFLFFIHEKIINRKFKYLIAITLALIIFFTALFETRTGYMGILLFLFYYFFFTKHKMSKKILIIFFLIIIPLLTFHGLKFYKINYTNYTKFKNESNSDVTNYNSRILSNTTSGRFAIYQYDFKQIKDNKIILGIGPQADRKVLVDYAKYNPSKIYYDNNSSNALLYSYLCGGIFSFTFLILIYYKISQLLLLSLKNNHLNKTPVINFSFLTLSFLTVRSIFENGLALFSIDLSLCLICYLILLRKVKK
jgi:hypothetical protein